MLRVAIIVLAAALLLVAAPTARAEGRVWLTNQTNGRVDILVDATPTCALVRFTGSNYGEPVSCTITLADGAHTITAVLEDGGVQAMLVDPNTSFHIEIRSGNFSELGLGGRIQPSATPIDIGSICSQHWNYPVLWLTSCNAAIQNSGLTPEARAGAYHSRAEYYLHRNEILPAIVDMSAAISIRPTYWPYLAIRCDIRAIGNVELDAALADCNEAVRLDQTAVPARYFRGLVYARRGQWAEALADFDVAIASDPQWYDARYLRGYARRQLGRSDGQADIDAALAQNPGVAENYAQNYGMTQ